MELRSYLLCSRKIAALQLRTEVNLATKIQELIIKAAAACYDCIQAELNSDFVTNPDGTIADSEAAAIEARLNRVLFSQAPLEPLVRIGVTVGEARHNGWRGIPDEPADDLWVYCRGVKAVVDRDHNVATSLCINIVWELNQPQFLPF